MNNNIIIERLREQNKELDAALLEQLSNQAETLREELDDFTNEYHDILNHIDIDDWTSLTGLTIDEMENMTLREIMERLREAQPTYEVAKTKRVDNYLMSIDKVSQSIYRGLIEHGDKNFEVKTAKKNNKQYHALVSAEFLSSPNVCASTSFNFYEWQIHNAIVSLSFDNKWITDYMIYEVVARTYYNKADANPSESALAEIRAIVNKIIHCKITINGENDITQKDDEMRKLEGFLISADKETRLLNGRVREGYLIHRNSLAYHYAQAKGQVITVPLKLLHTKVKFTKETSILKEYLVMRIAGMKNKKNKVKSREILFDTMFSFISFEGVNNKAIFNKKKRLKGQVEKMLQELVNDKFMKGFEILKDRIKIVI